MVGKSIQTNVGMFWATNGKQLNLAQLSCCFGVGLDGSWLDATLFGYPIAMEYTSLQKDR